MKRINYVISKKELISYSSDYSSYISEIGYFDQVNNDSCAEDFINKFSFYYLIGNSKDENCPNNIKQSCEWVEEEIMKIRDKKKWDSKDVYLILAWKTGNIDHAHCYDKKHKLPIEYCSGWNEKHLMARFPHQPEKCSIKAFSEDICNIKMDYEKKIKEKKDSKEIINTETWKRLVELESIPVGVGVVYLIALFSFLTRGEYPVYDRFAMATLLSFDLNNNTLVVPIGCKIKLKQIPDKNDNRAKDLLSKGSLYMKYYDMLNDYFNEEWKTNVNIDRALWVYGHFYKVEQ